MNQQSLRIPPAVTDPSAWRAAELEADKSWIVELTPAEVAEVADAARAVAARGLRGGEFGRADFPLPTFAVRLAAVLEELQHGRGITLLRGLPVDPQDEEMAARIIWGVGTYLGRALQQSAGVNLGGFPGNCISHIIDQRKDPNDRTVHGSATGAEQQPHCDPSDLVALLCIRPAVGGGGVSRVVSAMSVYNDIRERAPELLETLFTGFFHDLRKDGANGLSVTPQRVPVYGYEDGHLSVSFNSRTVVLAAEREGYALSGLEQRALDEMSATASRRDLVHEMTMRSGDLQLLNNYTMLHSRTAWSDPQDVRQRRCMLRLWLRTLDPRPLPEGFASGYLAGVTYDVGRQAQALATS
ncbi:TauD/TfdA family dioxygenase [Caenimonas sp. SL110]|uniref:TauD/TfdA family dioxygenase n=1 Tax=Caenimonas sp. SL110 TaxID=1450524 RepID=UPI000653EABC|nr:TauD/TfdA family dioxygenase [Caenimonas sp. SL110]